MTMNVKLLSALVVFFAITPLVITTQTPKLQMGSVPRVNTTTGSVEIQDGTGHWTQIGIINSTNHDFVPSGVAANIAATAAAQATAALASAQAGTLQGQSDAPGRRYPAAGYMHAPIASEFLTLSGIWDHVADAGTETHRVFAHSLEYISSTGKNLPGLDSERVNLYLGMKCLAGSGACWAVNTQTFLATGFTGLAAIGSEWDVTNGAQERGAGFGAPSYTDLNSWGVGVNSLSTYGNTSGYYLDGHTQDGSGNNTGGAWHRGYSVLASAMNSTDGESFVDYSKSYTSFASWGHHRIGLDLTNAINNVAGIALRGGSGNGISFLSSVSQEDPLPLASVFIDEDNKYLHINAKNLKIDGVPFKTSATPGQASALPATPAVYMPIFYAGAIRLIPMFNP